MIRPSWVFAHLSYDAQVAALEQSFKASASIRHRLRREGVGEVRMRSEDKGAIVAVRWRGVTGFDGAEGLVFMLEGLLGAAQ